MELPPRLQNLFERFEWRSKQLVRAVQSVVLSVLLFLVYFIGIGLTRILMSVFSRRHLKMFATPKKESYWLDAEGYTADSEQLLRQI